MNQVNECDYYGRWGIVSPATAQTLSGVTVYAVTHHQCCRRCGACQWASLPDQQRYCVACVALGRVSTRDCLVTQAEPNDFPDRCPALVWAGQLTAFQAPLAAKLAAMTAAETPYLLWAVTGSGKTEMLFPMLLAAFQAGERVAFVAPRVDVITELQGRFRSAFTGVSSVVLAGQTDEPYTYSQFVLATTHQLLRFYRAFDLIIVDESDSYPFVGSRMLAHALDGAVKRCHRRVYLTATPTPQLRQQVARKELRLLTLPLRFHQQPLPNVTYVFVRDWRRRVARGLLAPRVRAHVAKFIAAAQPFLIFVPRVADLDRVARVLREQWPERRGAVVHAQASERSTIIADFRQAHYDYLVTTTILERGVTFPKLQVMILGADDAVFNAAVLVQIAGRVGRAQDAPAGAVVLVAEQLTWAMLSARRQIRALNQAAAALIAVGEQ